MDFQRWTQELSKGILQKSEETPRILSWIYDAIDEDEEDLEEEPAIR